MKGTKIADNYLNSDSRDFWKEAEKLRGRKKLPITAVGGLTDSDDIADAFSSYYKTLHNSVDFNHDDMRSLYNDVSDSLCNCTDSHSHKITESDIGNAIRKLKSGKGDGYDGLTSDYLINGTPLLFYYLSTLFSLMLSHYSTPKSFCMSTMVPIPNKMYTRRSV